MLFPVWQETYENTSHQVHTLRRLIKEKEEAFQRRCHLEPGAGGLEGVGSEALARIGPTEMNEGTPASDLDPLAPAPPSEDALPLPPPPAPPLPPPPPPLPGNQGNHSSPFHLMETTTPISQWRSWPEDEAEKGMRAVEVAKQGAPGP